MDGSHRATAYVALGSNLHNPLQQVTAAIAALATLPQTQLMDQSPWYRSRAVGPGKQPDYINGVAAIETGLSPHRLLQALQAIEKAQGRVRTQPWGARTLDLDILLYNQLQLQDAQLQIPHPHMANRDFVLYPLADIFTGETLPDGRRLVDLLANCPATGIVRLSAEQQ